jgi:hypothetical protein
MLSLGRPVTGPNTNATTMPQFPVVHGGDHMAAAAAMVTLRATPAPFATTCPPVKTQIDIIGPATLPIEHLEPVWADLSHPVPPAFFLNLFGLDNHLVGHCSPPFHHTPAVFVQNWPVKEACLAKNNSSSPLFKITEKTGLW